MRVIFLYPCFWTKNSFVLHFVALFWQLLCSPRNVHLAAHFRQIWPLFLYGHFWWCDDNNIFFEKLFENFKKYFFCIKKFNFPILWHFSDANRKFLCFWLTIQLYHLWRPVFKWKARPKIYHIYLCFWRRKIIYKMIAENLRGRQFVGFCFNKKFWIF